MTREKSDNVEDGADEKMLDVDEKQQLARKDEVKFIASDRSNGDAKIDIGNIEKVRSPNKWFFCQHAGLPINPVLIVTPRK